jgi:FixJ family two-component response regulator
MDNASSDMAAGFDQKPLVLIVDDDRDLREALGELLETVAIETRLYGSTTELMNEELPDRPGCLILDIRMPGLSGLEFQNQLLARNETKPIIFLTAHGDVPMTVQAMKAGAVDFLIKPVRDQTMLDAVSAAIQIDIERRTRERTVNQIVQAFGTLTRREQQVMAAAAQGLLNKQIAFKLGITEVTVKLHRANVMKKLRISTIADLVRTWEQLPCNVRRE